MGGLGRGDARAGPREYRVAVEADLRDRIRVGGRDGIGVRVGVKVGDGVRDRVGVRVKG